MIHEKLTGRKIKRVCEERGLTVQDIQKKMKIGAHQSIYNWFNGKAMPSLDNYYTLCKILGVPMESLIVEDRENGMENEESIEEVEPCADMDEDDSSVSAALFWSDHLMEEVRLLGRTERFREELLRRVSGLVI